MLIQSQTKINKTASKTIIGAASLATALVFSSLFTPLASAAGKHKPGSGLGSSTAAPYSSTAQYTDYAEVTYVEPVYSRITHQNPKQECWYEQTEHTTHYNNGNNGHSRQANPAQTIVGGIVGGVIGNQLGRHTGSKKARVGATVAGAIFGSALANEGHNRHRSPKPGHKPDYTVTESQPVKHCKQVYETQYTQKIVAYNVTYRYRGRVHTVRMKRKPGHQLAVNVSVRPQG